MFKTRLIIFLILVTCILFLCSCEFNTQNQIVSSEEISSTENENASTTISSNGFLGLWYCSRENSCNDMDITLTITEQGGCMHLDRDMVSESGVGSSHLQYEAQVTDNNTLYSDYVDGVYVLTDDCLYEIFIKNGRINKYQQ